MKRIKLSPTLGHLTNFCTNFTIFLISENSLKFANFFAEVTNYRSMPEYERKVLTGLSLTVGCTSPALTVVGGSWSDRSASTGVFSSGRRWRSSWWCDRSRKNNSRWSHMCRCGIVGSVCCLTTGLFPLELMRPDVLACIRTPSKLALQTGKSVL